MTKIFMVTTVYGVIRNEYLRITNVSEKRLTHNRRRSTFVAVSKNGGVSVEHLMSVKEVQP